MVAVQTEINEDRLREQFIKLAEIPSPSFREREVGDYLIGRLEELGLTVSEDRVGEELGGNCGNLYALMPGDPKLPGLFLSCHMDTVEPGENIRVAFENGIFHSQGDTVLGGDDKGGITVILEMLEMLREHRLPHGHLEVLLTIGEEHSLQGSKRFDCTRLQSKFGYVLDSSGPPGTFVKAAPSQNKLLVTIRGRAAHAGFEPERGINAIQVAGQVLTRLRLGRIDEMTTANIGLIEGGKATNIVPDSVYMQGEVRSIERVKMESLTKELLDTVEQVTAAAGGRSEVRVDFMYPGFYLDEKQPVLQYAARAAKAAGYPVVFELSGGGSDANILNAAGIPTTNIGIGMTNVHTTEETMSLQDLVGCTRILWLLLTSIAAGEEEIID
jgi:tripeptide aminopeptidase